MGQDPDRRWRICLGLFALLTIWLFLGGAFASLLSAVSREHYVADLLAEPRLRRIVLFTLVQAGLSAVLSLVGAVPLSLALHRSRFRGRQIILRLFLLTQALPVLVGALAILTIWGRGGLVSDILAYFNYPRLNVYGLSGILIAHVFFNMPLAVRLMTSALDAVPAENWRLAGQLSMPPFSVFRIIEWPAIRTVIPGAASLMFMICITSFTLVLVLGGGPGATTLEVEIYQALRVDFDPSRAALLAVAQIALTVIVLLVSLCFDRNPIGIFTLGRKAVRYDRSSRWTRLWTALILAVGLAFIISPFIAVILSGLSADLGRLVSERSFLTAVLTSIATSSLAAVICLFLSLALLFGAEGFRSVARARTSWRMTQGVFAISNSIALVIPPIVIGAGWFLIIQRFADVFSAAPYMVVATNAVVTIPFVVRVVGPALRSSLSRYGRLSAHLGLKGISRLIYVDFPEMRRSIGLGFAFALSLSLGDFGVLALFGSEDFTTLPYLLYQRMGSYRTADAAGLALLLGLLSVSLIWFAERAFGSTNGRQ